MSAKGTKVKPEGIARMRASAREAHARRRELLNRARATEACVTVQGLDPLKPRPSTLAKLGSLIVHLEEFYSPDGHTFDYAAIDALLRDIELQTWIAAMGELGLVPLKRRALEGQADAKG